MSEPGYVDPSIYFGQEHGLFAYKMARSMDRCSERADEPILKLAEDAVRTAIRYRSYEGYPAHNIDIELAINGLMGMLEKDFKNQV